MDHITFVEQLQTIPLPPEAYKEAGLDDDYLDEVAERFSVSKRAGANVVSDDPVVALLNSFDVTKVEIGLIEFDNTATVRGKYTVFGKFEVDRLAIDAGGAVVLLEETADTVTMQCAADSGRFLDAVIHIGKFLEKRSVDDALFDDEPANRVVAGECAALAGGKQYVDFYTMMLGF